MHRPRPGMFMICGAALLAAVAARPVAASPSDALTFIDQVPANSTNRVVDVRDQKVCEQASLAGARCLSAADLFDSDGRPVDFHALRWLFGTIGLTGHERVTVVAANVGNASAIGALLFLAGQREVAVLNRPVALPASAQGGSGRNITREAVFTAPMRDRLLVASPEKMKGDTIDSEPPIDRLRRFARGTADGAQPKRLRLTP